MYSRGIGFDTSIGEKLLGKQERMSCHNINHYNVDPHFESAQSFLNLPIFEYVHLLINASKILLYDSSFLCLAYHLPIKTDECFFKVRVITRGLLTLSLRRLTTIFI